MNTSHLARWFVRNRCVSEIAAARMADAVVLRRKLKAEHLRSARDRAQLILTFAETQRSDMPPVQPDESVDF